MKASLAKRKANPRSLYWKKKCDALWSKLIKLRDGHKCIVCGTTVGLQSHHLIDKTVILYRHELLNGVAACRKHHALDVALSAHKAAWNFEESIRQALPLEQWIWWVEHRSTGQINSAIGSEVNYAQRYNELVAELQKYE